VHIYVAHAIVDLHISQYKWNIAEYIFVENEDHCGSVEFKGCIWMATVISTSGEDNLQVITTIYTISRFQR